MIRDNRTNDAIGFVRAVIETAMWEIAYHESGLPTELRHLKFAKEFMKRCGFDPDAVPPEPETSIDGDLVFNTIEQFIYNILNEARSSVEYHEGRLKVAHDALAFAKVMLARGNYTEIDIAEIQKQLEDDEKKRKEWAAR